MGDASSLQPPRTGAGQASLAYQTEAGFRAVALPYVLSGLAAGERVVCLLHDHAPGAFLRALGERAPGFDFEAALRDGQLVIEPALEHFAPNGVVRPEPMIERVRRLHDATMEEGWPALRILGEAGFLREMDSARDAWVRYEWLVDGVVSETATALCAYPTAELDRVFLAESLEPHSVRLSLPLAEED